MSETVAEAVETVGAAAKPNRLMIRMTKGMETMVRSNSAIEKAIIEMQREIRSSNEMLMRAQVGTGIAFGSTISPDGRVSAPPVMAPPSHEVPERPAKAEGGSGGRGGRKPPSVAPRPSRGPGPVGPDTDPVLGFHDADEEDEVSNWDTIMARKGYSMRRLRRDVGATMSEKIGTWASEMPTPPLRQGSAGNWMRVDPNTGRFIGAASASDIRKMNIANRVRTVGGNIAEQGLARGIVNSLPKAAAGAAGLAVAGGYLTKEIVQQFENQRFENARYQRVSGEDNISGGLERGREWMWTASQMGTMSSRDAARLYQGVYDLGLQGDERQNALEMAADNWRRFGMEIADSIELLRVSAQNGLTSLRGVAEGLDKVTESARETGVSAEAARDRYSATYAAAAPMMIGEGSAAVAASALSAATTRLGRGFEGIDLSGAFSASNITRLAGMQGMSPGQFAAQAAGPEGGVLMARAVQASVIDMARALLGSEEAYIVEYKAANNITGPLSFRQASNIAAEIMARNPRINPQAAMQMLSSTGVSGVTFNNALPMMILALDGTWNPEGEVEGVRESFMQTEIDTSSTKAMANAIGELGFDIPEYDDFNLNLMTPEQLTSYHNQETLFATSFEKARIHELRRVAQTGEFSPIIAALLKDEKQSRRFRVNDGTEENPVWREVSTKDLIMHYRDQAARGDVEIIGEGQTIAGAFGLNVDETVDVEYGKGLGKGQETGQGRGYQGVEGRIEVYPSPELYELLRFRSTSGSANMTVSPLPSQAGNQEYPGG
jgi:hypothetical protein